MVSTKIYYLEYLEKASCRTLKLHIFVCLVYAQTGAKVCIQRSQGHRRTCGSSPIICFSDHEAWFRLYPLNHLTSPVIINFKKCPTGLPRDGSNRGIFLIRFPPLSSLCQVYIKQAGLVCFPMLCRKPGYVL